jgi:predicted ester cyclase
MLEHNKAAIAKLGKLVREPHHAVIRELFTENFQLHDAKYPDWPRGHAGAIRMFEQMHSLAPDIELRVEDLFGDDEKICVRWRYRGTLTGAFEGRIGDGSRFEMIGISIYRFENGRIAEDWGADVALPAGHPWRQ